MSTKDFDFDPRAGRYYRGLNPLDPERVKRAISDGWTFVEEWSYEQDAHGYCHSRTDLIALLLEIQRLRKLVTYGAISGDVVVGWQAAQQALRTEGTRLQEEGNLTMWAALVSAADVLDHLRPSAAETGLVEGLIDVKKTRGVEEWTLTCSDCGLIDTYPMMFIANGERHAPEVAWDQHVAEKHPDADADEPTGLWAHYDEPPTRDPDWYIEQQAADVAFHRMGELP